jgi:hypothetical protein
MLFPLLILKFDTKLSGKKNARSCAKDAESSFTQERALLTDQQPRLLVRTGLCKLLGLLWFAVEPALTGANIARLYTGTVPDIPMFCLISKLGI